MKPQATPILDLLRIFRTFSSMPVALGEGMTRLGPKLVLNNTPCFAIVGRSNSFSSTQTCQSHNVQSLMFLVGSSGEMQSVLQLDGSVVSLPVASKIAITFSGHVRFVPHLVPEVLVIRFCGAEATRCYPSGPCLLSLYDAPHQAALFKLVS